MPMLADPIPDRLDNRPVVATFRSPVFNLSETFVQAQAAGLERYQPLVVGLEGKGNILPALKPRTLLARGGGERMAIKLFGRYGGLADRVRPWSPVLVHAHFGPDGLIALPLAHALGVPLVTTLRGYDVNRTSVSMALSGRVSWMRYALFKRRLMTRGALFLAVSEALRRKAIGQGYPAERTFTHYNGVDLALFHPRNGDARPGLILHVGRLVEKKGTMLLLDAFAKVREVRPDAALAVIGEGPLLGRLRRRSVQLGIEGAVRFLGAQPREAVADWMRRAWLLSAPSITARNGDSEGLPNVVVEAAASGLPVVASDHAGAPEAVVDGKSGFIVPEGNGDLLARRIAEVLQSPELRGGMAQRSRVLAEERFDFGRQMRRLERHYDRVLGVAELETD